MICYLPVKNNTIWRQDFIYLFADISRVRSLQRLVRISKVFADPDPYPEFPNPDPFCRTVIIKKQNFVKRHRKKFSCQIKSNGDQRENRIYAYVRLHINNLTTE
jgi:hypothetical protein